MNACKLIVPLFFFFNTIQIGFSRPGDESLAAEPQFKYSFGVVADVQYADADKKGNRDYRNSLKKLETSFGIIDVYDDKLVLKGYGDQNDQILEFQR